MKQLLAQVNLVQAELSKWLRKHQGKSAIRLNYKLLDGIRLIRLAVWAKRHYLELTELFDILIPVLQSRVQRKYTGLGVSIAALTGPSSYRILNEEINSRYPNGEHIAIWKMKQRQANEEIANCGELHTKQVSSSILAFEDTDDFVASFGRKNKRTAVISTRRYRWNPYL